ncbi:ImmA/IrrE family metallo-endopeptidase [Hymenobacter humi]|uniref:ImmA/IrrE family metallo-endopeptidase n=1 Tax=Hymenobacter humi TaxID=1411620 RepID=A0ABW2U386_9BACT
MLTQEYGYTLDRETLGQHAVATQARLRSVFQPKSRRLLMRPGLSLGQQAFVLGREVAFNYLKLTERPYVSSSTQVRSFDEVLNNFKASYFAGALLMEEESLLRDLRKVFNAKKWNPGLLLGLMAQYDVSPEMFMQRLTTLLPRHFGLQSLFFLRFDQANADAPYELTKELHLARLHNPHGNEPARALLPPLGVAAPAGRGAGLARARHCAGARDGSRRPKVALLWYRRRIFMLHPGPGRHPYPTRCERDRRPALRRSPAQPSPLFGRPSPALPHRKRNLRALPHR